jgi:hypothetical protein
MVPDSILKWVFNGVLEGGESHSDLLIIHISSQFIQQQRTLKRIHIRLIISSISFCNSYQMLSIYAHSLSIISTPKVRSPELGSAVDAGDDTNILTTELPGLLL